MSDLEAMITSKTDEDQGILHQNSYLIFPFEGKIAWEVAVHLQRKDPPQLITIRIWILILYWSKKNNN